MLRMNQVLRDLLPKPLAESVSVYVSALRRRRDLLSTDEDCRRLYRHDDPIARLLHERMVPLVAHAVDADVRPSYSFLAFYSSGSVLPPHTDRPPCKYNLGLCVNATRKWPFFVEGEKYLLGPGDAVLYPGQRPHWRKPLAKGHRVDMMLFHFVDADFDGPIL